MNIWTLNCLLVLPDFMAVCDQLLITEKAKAEKAAEEKKAAAEKKEAEKVEEKKEEKKEAEKPKGDPPVIEGKLEDLVSWQYHSFKKILIVITVWCFLSTVSTIQREV